jgi:hypothetical protein
MSDSPRADLLLSTADQSVGADLIVCGRFAPGEKQSEPAD